MAGVNRPAKQQRPGRRKHSFGGCRTCRRRHVKCDQIRPSCLACRAVNAVCEGYNSDVKWMTPSTLSSENAGQFDNDDSQNNTRHHLYSEASRASMSRRLQRSFGLGSVDTSLAEIDARTKDPIDPDRRDITVGPFGVLNVHATARDSNDNIAHGDFQTAFADSTTADPRLQDVDMVAGSANIPNEVQHMRSYVDWFDPILGFNSTLNWADLFGLDFDDPNNLLMSQQSFGHPGFPFEDLVQDTSPDQDNTPNLVNESTNAPHLQPPNDPHTGYSRQFEDVDIWSLDEGSECSLSSLSTAKSVSEAQSLLKHFHDFVIPQMSFMPSNSKSPWTILQLPEATRTLSELTYLRTGTLKHANAANLYGLLACSAHHLAVNPGAQSKEPQDYWTSLFELLREKAKKHLQLSLREELRGSSKAKYKDQLMAVLSMLAVSSLSGNQRDARCYMIDAERLLRMKGLAKRDISRKCRLLHHVYSWIRIVGESTYVTHDYSSCGPLIDNMSAAHRAGRLHGSRERRAESLQRSSGHNARLDDFLRLELHSSDSDLDIDKIKEHEASLRDIHLEDSRLYRENMYHIYGISETWLSLVSQTTRLANILDATKYAKNADGSFVEFLQKRAGRLENIICSFALKDPASDDEDDSIEPTEPRPPNYYMLRAMNSALVILFYRRIRNVNSLILQGHIDSVVQSLRDFDAALISHGFHGPGSAWPAFIAGCETLSRRNRRFLGAWLGKGFEKCGLECYGASRRLMQEVWERQDEPTLTLGPGSGDSSQSKSQKSASYQHSWVDICRERNNWVILF